MNIILEGPDCSGKTTLAKSGLRDLEYIHYGPPDDRGAWVQYVNALHDLEHEMKVNPEVNRVFDRFIYGELIYQPLLRPRTRDPMREWHLRMLERVLLANQAVLVYCKPPHETNLELWRESASMGNELLKTEKDFDTSYRLYENLMAIRHLPMAIYDLTSDKAASLLKELTAKLPPRNRGPGIGMFAKGVTLLVGDQVNATNSVWDWPFVATDGCSPWLATELDKGGIDERSLYWINAVDRRGIEADPAFIDQLHPGLIVALGKAAAIWCQRNRLQFTEVAHPQFHKRFRYNEDYPLIHVLNRR